MLTIEQIRLQNLKKLLSERGIKKHIEFASLIDRSPGQISQILKSKPTKSIGSDLARHIEKCLGLEVGYLDNYLPEPSDINAADWAELKMAIRKVRAMEELFGASLSPDELSEVIYLMARGLREKSQHHIEQATKIITSQSLSNSL